MWFLQLESQFALRGISNQLTKFHHVVSALPENIAMDVIDIITNPTNNPYDSIKDTLIQRQTRSDEDRYRAVLHDIMLGDEKPTQLLRKLQRFAPGTDQYLAGLDKFFSHS